MILDGGRERKQTVGEAVSRSGHLARELSPSIACYFTTVWCASVRLNSIPRELFLQHLVAWQTGSGLINKHTNESVEMLSGHEAQRAEPF